MHKTIEKLLDIVKWYDENSYVRPTKVFPTPAGNWFEGDTSHWLKENQIKEPGEYPLNESHICFEKGHSMYLVCEIDNGRSKYGEHKCGRCGYTEPFQFDYA